MQITVNDYIESVTNEQYEIKQVEAPVDKFEQEGEKLVQLLCQNFQDLVNAGKLAQSRILLTTKDEPVLIYLESGIINLPFANIKQVDNFFAEPENEVEVKVNLIVESPQVNASGLRIDEICSVEQLNKQTEQYLATINTKIQELLTVIQENVAVQDQEAADKK